MTVQVITPNGAPQLGNISNNLSVAQDGTLRLAGTATAFDDLLTSANATRTGVVAPTTGVGFRGNNNFYHVTFVHTQADEWQFDVQMPHRAKEGSPLFPHVHFSPTATSVGNQAVRYVLEFYAANVNAQFPAQPSQYEMMTTWAGDKQWYHLLASNAAALEISGWTLSCILKCRLWRDNTVANNYAGAVSTLYFDIHSEIDGFGSAEEYNK
jgi:hypothetical protein